MNDLLLLNALPSALVLLSLYLISVLQVNNGVGSVSETDYRLEEPFKWLFEFVVGYAGICLIFVSFYLREEPVVTLLVAGISFIGVAAFSRYKINWVGPLHYGFAIIGFVSLVFSPFLSFHFALGLFIELVALLFAVINSKKRNMDYFIWALEIAMIYSSFAVIQYLVTREVLHG